MSPRNIDLGTTLCLIFNKTEDCLECEQKQPRTIKKQTNMTHYPHLLKPIWLFTARTEFKVTCTLNIEFSVRLSRFAT